MDIPTKHPAYQEIRLNEKYAHLYISEFIDGGTKGDSKPIIKRKTLTTEKYIKKAFTQSNNSILPANCRYIEEINGGHLVIIEEPPAMRTIKVEMDLKHEIKILKDNDKLELYGYKGYDPTKLHTFSLAFPYVIFILYITENFKLGYGQVFLRPARMVGLSDYICKAPLLNIYTDQHICFGRHGSSQYKSLHEAIENTIMVFWSATFNTDFSSNYNIYENTPFLSTYLEWNYMSEKNPMFVYNAEWIKLPHPLGKQIELFKTMTNLRSKQNIMDFFNLSQKFYTPIASGKKEKVSPKSKNHHMLYYDICQSIFIDDVGDLNVGDTITMKNGDLAYVDSFAGFSDTGSIKYIVFECNDKYFHMKLHNKAVKFLSNQLKKQRFAETARLKNNIVVKPNDIIIIEHNKRKIYQKIKYIRKSRGTEGDIKEIRLYNDYYLADNLEAEIFDTKNPVIYGMTIEKNEKYLLPHDTESMGAVAHVSLAQFQSLDVVNNHITANFRASILDRKAILLDQPYSFQPLYKEKDCKPLPSIVRIGRKIYNITPKSPSKEIKDDVRAWSFGGRLFINERFSSQPLESLQVKYLIKDNVFSIAGVDFNTSFEIGDKVVYADWTNPLDVLNVKTITGFNYNSSDFNIYFVLSDKNGNLSSVKYVDGMNNIIYTGKIRKVTSKYKKLSVGTKIIATKAGIPAFPKKDINIVVAIIIDSPYEPLILCSNGCTLWYSTIMSDFEKITMRSKKWKTLDHVPLNLSKIKFQAGDIINGRSGFKINEGYILFNPIGSKTPRALQCNYYNQDADTFSYTVDKHMLSDIVFDCIPNPRVGTKAKYKAGFYDFHGRLIDDFDKSFYSFIDDKRGNIDVPNTHK